ncbi:hypothetical protein KIPB_005296 [Kipferlia bialata]|uniref:Uncharacterized protein n=1 Tax=Kipferlia bialata TaxID=797122 RepID=A0A9K3GIT3_9EUKA|nr:hypothetical protein KIPB_005296 [Kipferlia bialata]|eukprot:g5296.t1
MVTLCDGEGCPQRENCIRYQTSRSGRCNSFGSAPYNHATASCEHFMRCYRIGKVVLALHEQATEPSLTPAPVSDVITLSGGGGGNPCVVKVTGGEVLDHRTAWGATYTYMRASASASVSLDGHDGLDVHPGLYFVKSVEDAGFK